ncbi:hypothetical protein [Novosphingobium sp. CECT 9465]|uniref:hypothetical protein n=1 Tax=Novosphingobium sp. CECT 9465 TaxID=2829794 RepID=UPI001E518915|nr:hypothetical protein [Novosphingobium sp. CECT 9465]CAH0496968.1 hypothetical protein NVSP9465_02018 [Novosphingobium sp. CECT 9465]
MSEALTIATARALRDEALAIFRADLQLAKTESSPARIKERAVDEAVEMIDTVRDVAIENKAVVGAILAMLTGWLFRGQLIDLGTRMRDTVRPGD